MPKENINDTVTDGFRAEVSWSGLVAGERDGYVQLATVNAASTLTLSADGKGEPEPFDGWRVTLDRAGINRLIRSLRKARDAAYGADA